MNREQFKQQIFQQWARRYNCPVEALAEPANVIVRKQQAPKEQVIHIWSIGERTFVEVDSIFIDIITALCEQLPLEHRLTAEDVQTVLGEKAVQDVTMGQIHYLYPDDLPARRRIKDYHLQQMRERDQSRQESLFAVCMPEEVEEGMVNVTDEIAFGAIHNEQMVALASAYPWLGSRNCLDIGVLVHPEFRRYGLGKAVVREICAWGIEREYLLQYRSKVDNQGAQEIAKGLGFEQYLSQTSVWLK